MFKVYQYKADRYFVTGKSMSGACNKAVEIDDGEYFAVDGNNVKIGSAIVKDVDINELLKYSVYVNDMSYMNYVTFYNDMLNKKHGIVDNIINQSDHTLTNQDSLIMRGVKFKKF